jgi:hypothetical protein
MRVLELLLGIDGSPALRLCPSEQGLTIVPVDELGVTPIEIARALRQTLAQHQRGAAQAKLRRVQISLESGRSKLMVLDDQPRGVRAIRVETPGEPLVHFEARLGRLDDAPKLEALLVRIANAAGESVPEDLGPSLASVRVGQRPEGAAASPKEQALLRAHEKARAAAEKVRGVDRELGLPGFSWGRWFLAGFIALASLIAVSLLVGPAWRHILVPIYLVAVLTAWISYGVKTARALSKAAKLEEARAGLREEREAARREEHDLAETMAKKGADPDEVLARLRDRPAPREAPAILGQADLSSAEVLELTGVGRQVILFVERRALLLASDYPDALRTFQLMGAAPPPPPLE